MSTYKIVKGKDGKFSTQDGPSEATVKAQLERTRRELRDMIAGNTQFHDDPRAERHHGDYCIHHMLPEPCRMCSGGVAMGGVAHSSEGRELFIPLKAFDPESVPKKASISVTVITRNFNTSADLLKQVTQALAKAPIQQICPDHCCVLPCRHCYDRGSCFANL